MPDYSDLITLIREPTCKRHLPCFYDFAPCHAGVVGGIPNLTHYYFDLDEKLEIQTRVKKLLPEALVLPGIFPDFGVVVEASAFGGQIRWLDNGAPYIAPILKDIKDIDTLKPPIPGTTGLTALLLVQQKIMKKKVKAQGQELEKWAFSMGPAEIAGLLLGYEKYYYGFYDDSKRIKTLMEMLTEFVINWIRVQEKEIGGALVIMVADHVCSQVSPEHLETLILPFEQAIFSSFPHAVKIYHNEGFHSDRHIEAIIRFGAEIWHFGSDVHSIKDLYSKVGDRIVLFGGLDPMGIIRTGSPEEVRVETRKVIEAARGRKLLLSTGTGTSPDVPLENIRAMIEEALI